RLPHFADFVVAQGAPAVGAGLEAFGARALGLPQAREDVVAGAPCVHGPFQERAAVLAQLARRSGLTGGFDGGYGGDEIAAGEVGDVLAHEFVKPAIEAAENDLASDDLRSRW